MKRILWFACVVILMTAIPTAGGVLAAEQTPQLVKNPEGVSPAGMLNPDGTLNPPAGFRGSLDLRGWDVRLDDKRGPRFSPAGKMAEDATAGTWVQMPPGATPGLGGGSANALAVVGNDIYVGGDFTQTAGGLALNSIGRYDLLTNTWHQLLDAGQPGLNSSVRAFAVSGNNLYIGGWFTATTGGTALNRVARYDMVAGTWHQMLDAGQPGVNNIVSAMAMNGNDLYIGGGFENTTGGTPLNYIVRYDTLAGTWNPLFDGGVRGMDNWVMALLVDGNNLYLGGGFHNTQAGTVMNHIARYDMTGGTWHQLLDGAQPGLNNFVRVMTMVGSDLYAGGDFTTTTTGTLLNQIGRYNTLTSTWHPLMDAGQPGLDAGVRALAAIGSDLYIGGYFVGTQGGTTLNYIGLYDTATGTWYQLLDAGQPGVTGGGGWHDVYAFKTDGNNLYIAGSFVRTTGGMDLYFITRFVRGVAPTPAKGKVRHVGDPLELPKTGFPPGMLTTLPPQPHGKSYADLGELWLEIPSLKVKVPIVGVPLTEDGWDVSWLSGQAGWLEGTAFPTWNGNSALTAHVINRSGTSGPFAELSMLAYDDLVVIHAWGQKYTYQVRSNRTLSASSVQGALPHEEYRWVTLLTCQDYNPYTKSYRLRRIVRAVLVSMKAE